MACMCELCVKLVMSSFTAARFVAEKSLSEDLSSVNKFSRISPRLEDCLHP